MHERKFFILVGPSGCGKTTLGNYLKEELGVPEVVSHTTRSPRAGEIDGEHYHFVSFPEWEAIDKVERSEYDGNRYCLSRFEVEEKFSKSNVVFSTMDINGANQIKEMYPFAKIIFITLPIEEMEVRMKARGDAANNIRKRIGNAINEKEHLNVLYSNFVIENYDLEESKRTIKSIVQS